MWQFPNLLPNSSDEGDLIESEQADELFGFCGTIDQQTHATRELNHQ